MQNPQENRLGGQWQSSASPKLESTLESSLDSALESTLAPTKPARQSQAAHPTGQNPYTSSVCTTNKLSQHAKKSVQKRPNRQKYLTLSLSYGLFSRKRLYPFAHTHYRFWGL